MELLTNKKFVQKMIIALVFVILFNFVSPQISFGFGGQLFEPIKDLSLTLGDAIVWGMQKFIFGMDISIMKMVYDHNWVPKLARCIGRSCCRRNCCSNWFSSSTIFRRR